MEDDLYNQILNFYISRDRKYPQHIYTLDYKKKVDAKSKFRQTVKPFRAVGGILYRGEKEVLTRSRMAGILNACHDNPTSGGHFGRDKTLAKVSERYYWKGMTQDINNYVKVCTQCFAINPKMDKAAPPLHSIPVPGKIWGLVGIDIIGPLQETTHGKKYIVAITDHFSKWSEAAAIKDKSATSVAIFLYSVVCRLGCMDALISDQGREFVNEVIDKLMTTLQSDHRIASAYHPQSNGQRERDNRTLKDALSKLVNEQGDNWDQYIPGVLFANHTSVHSSTKFTPFEVMYGRKAKLPLDLQPENFEETDEIPERAVPDVLETMNSMRKDIASKLSSNIATAQQRQKKAYDKRHDSNKEIDIGSTVYVKNARRIHRMGGKMEPRWIGPYTVVESLSKGRVKLKNDQTDKVLKNTYHACNLKIYKDGNEPDSVPVGECKPLGENTKRPLNEPYAVNTDHIAKKAKPCMNEPDAVDTDHVAKKAKPSMNDVDTEHVSKTDKLSEKFNPLSSSGRKNLCLALGLTYYKSVYFGRPSELREPRRVHKTKGDGNCYFRAISFILSGSEDNHAIIREKIIRHMNTDLQTKLKNYLNQNVEEYVKASGVSLDGVWATDAEVMATASLLGCDVIIHSMVGKSMEWLTYPATFNLQQKTEHALYLENVQEHFNAVISV